MAKDDVFVALRDDAGVRALRVVVAVRFGQGSHNIC